MNYKLSIILHLALIIALLYTVTFSPSSAVAWNGDLSMRTTLSECSVQDDMTENESSVINDQPIIHSHDNKSMKIALTFDDGPSIKYTGIILDILKKYNIRATFFVIGENAEQYPELVQREILEGHEIGNHTYSHCKISKLDSSSIQNELICTEEVIYEIDDYRPSIFRPPEGKITGKVVAAARELDYSIIMWNIDTRDWAHTPVDEIVDNVLTNVKSGDIILFHDFVSKTSPTPQALEKIIPILLERGYNFVTVSELIGSE